jgi:hypothetical protein
MKIRAIVTGATGMVGEGVLHECLLHNDVDEVLVITRRTCGIKHPKLKEIIHANFFDITPVKDQLKNYNACFFCLGVTSLGKKEDEYYNLTYTLTMHVAETLSSQNHDMTFCYISGAGTDSTEKGKLMWARIKGKTENDLMKLPFRNICNFRPGLMKPTKGLKHTLGFYKFIVWLYPVLKAAFPKFVCTLKELGLAMINTINKVPEKHILEVRDIVELANK